MTILSIIIWCVAWLTIGFTIGYLCAKFKKRP